MLVAAAVLALVIVVVVVADVRGVLVEVGAGCSSLCLGIGDGNCSRQ